MFDGDNRSGRALEACRAAVASSASVWVLGEQWLLSQLEGCGIDGTRLHHDAQVDTTLDQMEWVARFVQSRPASRVAVVASLVQMPRVGALSVTRGLDLVFFPSPLDRELPSKGWSRFAPSAIALRTSRDAIYEHVALRYYRWRGWIVDS